MRVLLDTNILLRSAEPKHSAHALATQAIRDLHQAGVQPVIVPQVLYEFWAVATRPLPQSGLGFTAASADGELNKIRSLFVLLDDSTGLLAAWRELVMGYQVMGKSSHDARLVAAMQLHGLTDILTFNRADFVRYRQINVRTPGSVVGA